MTLGIIHQVPLRRLTWLRLLRIALVFPVLPVVPSFVMAQDAVTVRLDPVGGSQVSGTATLSAFGDGTKVALDIKGLAPGAVARGTMQAGTCAWPSASFATLPDLKADATGRAKATGSVLYHGTENVALEIMADGEHIIAIQVGKFGACGMIPTPQRKRKQGRATPNAQAALLINLVKRHPETVQRLATI